jgi:hypothetical protein
MMVVLTNQTRDEEGLCSNCGRLHPAPFIEVSNEHSEVLVLGRKCAIQLARMLLREAGDK